jgi:YhcH/YjgK/YiaL family protein
MKNLITKIMVLAGLLSFFGCKNSTDPAEWNAKQINKWFEKGEWLNGWQATPDSTINRKEFAISYFKHKERWNKAFAFFKDSNFATMEIKRYEIDDDNVFALLSEYLTKSEEEARYEAHQRYADIQYVASGKELIGIAPLSAKNEILQPYDSTKDIMFLSVNEIINHKATPDRFFIFFPDDAHRPGLRDGDSTLVRKVVIKVKLD